MCIYTVYYYNVLGNNKKVYLIGIYNNIYVAIEKLKIVIPNYKQHINNTVIGNNLIGWVNKNNIGDTQIPLIVNQPHSAVDLFNVF
jgi:hypothetical protein